MMKKENSDLQLNKLGLFKIFSSLDTQSAIVAAVVISVSTFLASGFIDLCNYIYWNAYFTEFKIPMAYFDEAIIHEEGIKYVTVLCIPILILIWYFLGLLKKGVKYTCSQINRLLRFKRLKHNLTYINKILAVCLFLMFALFSFYGLTVFIRLRNIFYILLYVEVVLFVFWNCSKMYFRRKFTFSKKNYYFVRIIGIAVMIYVILGNVYYSGSFQNYSRNSNQIVKLVNYAEDDYHSSNQEEVQAQLVLLETADYYYVTDVIMTNKAGLKVQVLNDDSYRFIDKVDCPVKSVYANLSYIRGRREDDIIDQTFGYFFAISLVSIITFVALLSIPMKKISKADS